MWHRILQHSIRPIYHGLVSYIGAFWYGLPSKRMRVVAVTGTKGKSTVVRMIVSVARQAGWCVAYSSSIGYSEGTQDNSNTVRNSMPGRFRLHRMMAEALKNGADLFVMEATSEGLAQNRHRGIHIDGTVFTNLYPEHIEAHGSFEAYKQAKGRLFRAVSGNTSKTIQDITQYPFAVLNGDSEHAVYYAACSPERTVYVGLTEGEMTYPNIRGKIQERKSGESRVLIQGRDEDPIEITVPLAGEFNVLNALLTFGVGKELGLSSAILKEGLESLTTVPGRMEQISEHPRVIVDYAHIPEALERVYTTLVNQWKRGDEKIIAVLGSCGGGRDTWKRAPMGRVAGEYADYVIVTNEDPYDEDPQKIIDEVFAGVAETGHQEGKTAFRIRYRRDAFRKALALSDSDDIIIITGKGSETSIVEDGKTYPWNDKAEMRTLLAERSES